MEPYAPDTSRVRILKFFHLYGHLYRKGKSTSQSFVYKSSSQFLDQESTFHLDSRVIFIDHTYSDSIFTILKNAELFHPLISKLIMKISIDFKTNQDLIIKLLDCSQDFLQSFLSALFMTTGVPSHSWQAVQLCYANTGQLQRNLMLVNQEHLIFANASAGLHQLDTTDSSVWLLLP